MDSDYGQLGLDRENTMAAFHDGSACNTVASTNEKARAMNLLTGDQFDVALAIESLSISQPLQVLAPLSIDEYFSDENIMDDHTMSEAEANTTGSRLLNVQYMPSAPKQYYQHDHKRHEDAMNFTKSPFIKVESDLTRAAEEIAIRITTELSEKTAADGSPVPQNKKHDDTKDAIISGQMGAFAVDVSFALLNATPLPYSVTLEAAFASDIHACAETMALQRILLSYSRKKLARSAVAFHDENDGVITATAFGEVYLSEAIYMSLDALRRYYRAVQQSIESKGELIIQSLEKGEIDEKDVRKIQKVHRLCGWAEDSVDESTACVKAAWMTTGEEQENGIPACQTRMELLMTRIDWLCSSLRELETDEDGSELGDEDNSYSGCEYDVEEDDDDGMDGVEDDCPVDRLAQGVSGVHLG
ncbi:uncharacterized protein LTHEOB_9470 [Lasiodiplodia theobromae]|uniref:uncharacterized protein n=1 Tax=Lasiodiplodia theobromae TaxID=45133 RepID=UPI0015C2C8FF|nr:uncharacterized protein LTHEOB_9470 [Lasiodiplodia theobromae]KAF4539996.1 hypothetical protein LTHEOB_9470 [Lasiodiplodia theobromae]